MLIGAEFMGGILKVAWEGNYESYGAPPLATLKCVSSVA
jgi:hypothetical protein